VLALKRTHLQSNILDVKLQYYSHHTEEVMPPISASVACYKSCSEIIFLFLLLPLFLSSSCQCTSRRQCANNGIILSICILILWIFKHTVMYFVVESPFVLSENALHLLLLSQK
jgi:hypothetical protein